MLNKNIVISLHWFYYKVANVCQEVAGPSEIRVVDESTGEETVFLKYAVSTIFSVKPLEIFSYEYFQMIFNKP